LGNDFEKALKMMNELAKLSVSDRKGELNKLTNVSQNDGTKSIGKEREFQCGKEREFQSSVMLEQSTTTII
jgi:hypothetical protein